MPPGFEYAELFTSLRTFRSGEAEQPWAMNYSGAFSLTPGINWQRVYSFPGNLPIEWEPER
jgi:hypothetical protein